MSEVNTIANIDEIYKGLTKVDGGLNNLSATFLKVMKNVEDFDKVSKNFTQTTENLNKSQQATNEIQKQKDAANKALAASEQKLLTFDAAIYEQLQRNNKALADNKKAINDKIKASESEEGSLVRMRQKLSELTAQYDKTGARTKEAAKEIDALSREIGKAEAATNRHQRGVGGYADQLGKLPGPIGAAAASASGLGKQLWALVMNPIVATIAVIVGALALLYKAFTATDSGAVSMAGALKAVGNVMDILIDRSMSMFKALFSLVTFDWAGMMKNGKDAFGGLGKAIGDVTEAGKKYATAMDDIDDREVAAANRMTKLRVDIETLKNKAAAETGKKKMDMLEQAMNKEIELNGIEKGFLKERNDVENMNLASKMQNDKLTTAQKEAQLAQWLLVDDKELESLKQKDSAFAEFMDKNEGEFQTLQKSKADELNKEAELQTGTRRLQKGLATERDAENKKAIQDAKDRQAKLLEGVETADIKEKVLISKRHTEGITDEKGYQAELIAQEVVFLNKKQALYKPESKEYQDIELQKQAITIKSQDDILKAIEERFKQQKAIEEQGTKDLEDLLKGQTTAEEKAADEAIKTGEQLVKDKQKLDADYAKSKADKDKKIKEAAIDLAFATMNAVFDINANKLSAELSDLDKKKEKDLSNKNLTEAQKARIEADYQKKANAIKAKQDKNDKEQALFNIAMNTAVAAIKGLSEGGPLLMAIYIALGLVQAAVVMAKPLPKYKAGTMNAEREGIFGEAGLEVMFPKGGGAIFADKPTYFKGDKFQGAQIKTHMETERMMSMVADRNIIVRNQTDDRLLDQMKRVETAIMNKPVAIYDKDHRQIGLGNSQHQTIYLNRLTRSN